MKKIKFYLIQRILDELEKDCNNWKLPENVLIIERCADAYAVGFEEAIKQIRLRLNMKEYEEGNK